MTMNPSRFDLASLRLFVFAADAGSLTAGAERYGISLAAASKRIAELEARVGSALLLRSKQGVTPTPAGHTLKRHAIELVARLEQMAVAMADFQRDIHGHLRLWANTSAFAGFLPEVLADYSTTYPHIKLDLEDMLSDVTARAVATGAVELGIVGENTLAEDLETLVCDVDDLVLLIHPGHALTGKGTVSLAQAIEYDFVALGRTTSLTRHIHAAAEAAGRSLKVRVQVRSFDAMSRMVATGLGIAVLPSAGALPHASALGLEILHLDGPWTKRRLLLAMRDRQSLSGPASAFVTLVEKRMEERTDDIA